MNINNIAKKPYVIGLLNKLRIVIYLFNNALRMVVYCLFYLLDKDGPVIVGMLIRCKLLHLRSIWVSVFRLSHSSILFPLL